MAAAKSVKKSVVKAKQVTPEVPVKQGLTKTVGKFARRLSISQARITDLIQAGLKKAKKTKDEAQDTTAIKEEKTKKAKDVTKSKKQGKTKDPAEIEQEVVEARRKELASMYVSDLRELALSKGLAKGDKTAMIESVLAFEAKARAEVRAQEEKVKDVVDKMRNELVVKSNDDVKEMCRAKALALGGSKTDRIVRILELAKKNGEVQTVLDKIVLDARRAELLQMEKDGLFKLCQQMGIDPLLKEVMVERIVLAEAKA